LGNDSSSDLVTHSGNIHASSLRWRCLVALIGCWGRKVRCLVILAILLLLLLRELPLILLVVLTLMQALMSLRVTLLELLG
jgi:hypothetical protein